MSAKDVVAFIHKVETALDLFSSDRGGEACGRGRWWSVETSKCLKEARAKRDCAPIRFAETAQLPFVLAR